MFTRSLFSGFESLIWNKLGGMTSYCPLLPNLASTIADFRSLCRTMTQRARHFQEQGRVICNQQVVGSSPTAGSTSKPLLEWILREQLKEPLATARQRRGNVLPNCCQISQPRSAAVSFSTAATARCGSAVPF